MLEIFSDDAIEIDESTMKPVEVDDVDDPTKQKEVDDPTKISSKHDEEDTIDIDDFTPSDKDDNSEEGLKDDKGGEGDPPPEEKPGSKIFSSIVKVLTEEGELSTDYKPEDAKDIDYIVNIIKDLKSDSYNAVYEGLNPTQKEYIDLTKDGIPHDTIVQYQKNQDIYNNITDKAIEEEDDKGIELRRSILTRNFMSLGLNEVKAKKQVDRIVDSGDDIEEAKDALKALQKSEADYVAAERKREVKSREAEEAAEAKSLADFKKSVEDTKEIIPGLAVSKAIKDKVLEAVTTSAGTTKEGRQVNAIDKYIYDNPIESRRILGYLLTITDNFKNMDMFSTTKATKKSREQLNKLLEDSDTNDGGVIEFKEKGASKKTSFSDFDLAI